MTSIQKTNWLETAEMNIEIVTPTSVATDETLGPLLYLYNPKTSEVFYLKTIEWFRYLNRKRILNQYETLMERPPRSVSLYEWLVDRVGAHGVTDAGLGSAVLGKSVAHKKNLRTRTTKSLNDIKPHIRLLDGRIYIPGSSIKGMIRQAILFDLLQKDLKLKASIWGDIKQQIDSLRTGNVRFGRVKSELRKIEGRIVERLLHKLKDGKKQGLDYTKLPLRNAGLADVLSGLQCSDAMPVGDVRTEILQKVDLTMDPAHDKNFISVFRESIVPGSKFTFRLSIDTYKMSLIGIHSIADVEKCILNYYDFLNSVLYSKFKQLHGNVFTLQKEASAYLGGNVGFNHKSLLLALAPSTADATNLIKVILNESFRKRPKNKPEPFSPRTLKGTMYNGQIYLTGGVRISVG